MSKFRKKPIVIDAVQYLHNDNQQAIEWMNLHTESNINKYFKWNPEHLIIKTLEGNMMCNHLDWIIKGVNGEFYPCKPDIFEKIYEPVIE